MEGNGEYTLVDVHGAGAQRSDPKTGDASDYPYGHGPQGDVIRATNYAVCVIDMQEARRLATLLTGTGSPRAPRARMFGPEPASREQKVDRAGDGEVLLRHLRVGIDMWDVVVTKTLDISTKPRRSSST